MGKLLTFLRTFQDSPLFANLALHAWAAAWLVTAFSEHFSLVKVLGVGVVLAALKEFWFDTRYEIPAQQIGSIAGGGALQDFTGYCIGLAFGAGTRLLSNWL